MMNVELIDRLTSDQILDLYSLYQREWWTEGRELADINGMLQHCDVIVAFCDADSKRLVAFARVLTDYVYKALIFDVIVTVEQRGASLGRALIDHIVNHPALKSVRHFELYCRPELMPFYEKWDFTNDLGELCFMRRITREQNEKEKLN